MKNQRSRELLSTKLRDKADKNSTTKALIMSASSDEGVIRNFGRNGSMYAPKALLHGLMKFNNHLKLTHDEIILTKEVWPLLSLDSFESKQNQSAKNISKLLQETNSTRVVHLGGGHDHALALLLGIEKSKRFSNCIVINIDAHCDTRVDTIQHSGTPFRDFDRLGSLESKLIQFGIHEYANSSSTLSELTRINESRIFYQSDENTLFNNLKEILDNTPFEVNDQTAFVISLDCDGIQGESMGAVSAVNTIGITPQLMFKIIQYCKKRYSNLFFGAYEFNPTYDTTSHQGKKLISHFIYEFLK